jgi:dTDP-4-dehydrorhamnose reductase
MSFWKDKKVFVTGAHGFVGNNLMKLLKNKQCEILAPTSKELDLTKEEQVKDYFFTISPTLFYILLEKWAVSQQTKLHPENFSTRISQWELLSWNMHDKWVVKRL